tara:strand:- start:1962 stop:2951 length:990 start_codon:yes stop_codon:yes gene_type:complete
MNWFDLIKMSEEKGMRKVREFLRENGYAVTATNSGGKHDTITVKRLGEENDPDAETHTMTVSHRVTNQGHRSRLKMVLNQINKLFAGRRRRGQGEFKLKTDETDKENWWSVVKNLEKIKTSEGKNLRVIDVGRFQDTLRTMLISHIVPDLTKSGKRQSIVFKDKMVSETIYEFTMSLKPRKLGGARVYYTFVMRENDEGDYEYVRVTGPELLLRNSDVVESEYQLMKEIYNAVGRITYKEAPPKVDITIKTEDEKTLKEVARELEQANPGYRYDFEKRGLVKKPKDEYEEDVATATQNDIKQSVNTLEEIMERETGLGIEAFIRQLRGD